MSERPKKALRILCLVYFALIAANYCAAVIEDQMPIVRDTARAVGSLSSIYAAGSNLAFFGALFSTAGLLVRKKWAAHSHIASTALMVAFGCAEGGAIYAGPRALASTAVYVVTGMLYGLSFFTDALVDSDD